MQSYTLEQVAEHSTREDCWVVVNDKVFDVTNFLKLHPGGAQPLLEFAGKDATVMFYSLHRSEVLDKYMDQLCIGNVSNPKHKTPEPKLMSAVPFTEIAVWSGFNSPYYTEDHMAFQKEVRVWLNKHLKKDLESLEQRGKFPKRKHYAKIGMAGIQALKCGLIYGIPGVKCFGRTGKQLDYFHELILHQETAKLNVPGAMDCLCGGNSIGVPPLIIGGNKAHIKEIVTPVLMGKENICLAVTEPYVGSDVAGLRTTAVLDEDGEHYIINGVKKWITGGMMADWFTIAARTGGPGHRGVTAFVVPRSAGVKTTKIRVSTYSPAAGTAYVEFDNVRVHKKYMVGKLNQGFKVIMANFNHERWMIGVMTLAGAANVVKECFLWANQRKVFGKRLIDQPVIRNKLGYMTAKLMAAQAFAEQITHQMKTMDHRKQFKMLGGPTALLKVQATTVTEFITSEACQILGGRALTHGGMGTVVQRARSQVKNSTIYGGSEEIMADLGVRQMLKTMKTDAKL